MHHVLKQFVKVYQMLEDEESRDIYLKKLDVLISGDLKYTDNIVYSYLQGLPDRNKELAAAMEKVKETLPADRKVVFYGAGKFAPNILRYWKDDERLIGFCSQTKWKQKSSYLGYSVISPEELFSRKDLSVLISVDSAESREEIKATLREENYPPDQIYEIPEIPIACDEGQYFGPDFVKLGEGEVFVDAGCFDLGSSLEFRRRCKHVKKVYAFEPEPCQYQACLKRKAEECFSAVELLPYGVWSERTTLHFNATKGSASCMCEDGELNVPVIPIDEIVDPADHVTMIKMDIEGAELEALKGSKKVIQRDKPRLAICIYHKPEDMTEIPLYIKELVPEYKLYIRHHSNAGTETVLYAVMS